MFKTENAFWAVSPLKVDRAIKKLKDENKIRIAQGKSEIDITEEVVKDLYIQYGGAIIGDESTYRGNSSVSDDFFENSDLYKEARAKFNARKTSDIEETEESPKRRRRNA